MAPRPLSIASWNLYLGADIVSLVDLPGVPPIRERARKFHATVGATDFPKRAAFIAQRIVETQSELVALQEVFRYTITPAAGSLEVVDFLVILQSELARRRARYVAHRTWGFTCTVPLPDESQLTMEDSLVTLVRADLEPGGAAGGRYIDYRSVPIGGTSVAAHRCWQHVDVSTGAGRLRLTNTHLEYVEETREKQGVELLGRLDGHPGPSILAGDFNLDANVGGRDAKTLHAKLLERGFRDAWLERGSGKGLTSTQDEDLRNPESKLTTRIDWVLTRGLGACELATLVGAAQADRDALGLWPSDHAGLSTRHAQTLRRDALDRFLAEGAAAAATSTESLHGRTRFVAETRDAPGVGEFARRVDRAFPGVEVRIAPVFEDSTDPNLSRFFSLDFPRSAGTADSAEAHDLGYELEDALDLAGVDVVRYEPLPDDELLAASSGGSSGGGGGGDKPPDEPRWHLERLGVERAWEKTKGAGILIAQPDTGIADHHLLTDALDPRAREPGLNLLEPALPPRDPLWSGYRFLGHGTATAGVAASRGLDAERVVPGVAPHAKVLPLRCMNSPILTVWDAENVANAIRRAVDAGAHIVSLSLGSQDPTVQKHVSAAIAYGSDRGVIFVAAAGNVLAGISWISYPGWDGRCVCVGGSTYDDTPWSGASRGSEVAVSGPAEDVPIAWREPGDNPQVDTRKVRVGRGTSYATAAVGGVAALWLAYHGVDRLRARFRGQALTRVFRKLLRLSAVAPPGWDSANYGAGIVDAGKLLDLPLDAAESAGDSMELTVEEQLRAGVRDGLLSCGVDAAIVDRLDTAFVDRFGPELHTQTRYALLRARQPDATLPAARISERLRAELTRRGGGPVLAALGDVSAVRPDPA